jgi:hypothetical protein
MVTVNVSTVKAGASDSTMSIIREIVSGGETSTDRTALEMSVMRGILGGGWRLQTRLAGLGANSRVQKPVYGLVTVGNESDDPAKASELGKGLEGVLR